MSSNYPDNNPFGDLSQEAFNRIVNGIIFDEEESGEHDRDVPSDQGNLEMPPYNEPLQVHAHPAPVTATELIQRIMLAWEGDSTLSQANLVLRPTNDQGVPQRYDQVSLSYCDVPLLQGFEGISLVKGQFEKACMPHASLPSADLAQTNWRDARAAHLYAPGANFTGSDIRRANFDGADLSHALIVHTLCDQADFSHARLDEALCTQGTSFQHSQFLSASCRDTDFREAVLRGADFSGADLSGANLSMASMQHVRLAGTQLIGCRMTRTDLHYADLLGVRLGEDTKGAIAMLEQADLSCVKAAIRLLTIDPNISQEALRTFRERLRTPETVSGDPVHVQLGIFVPSGIPDRLAGRDQTLDVQLFLNGAYPLIGEAGTPDPEHNPMPILLLLGRWLDAIL